MGDTQEKPDLAAIGQKIGQMIGMCKMYALLVDISEAELVAFEAYLSRQGTLLPILDPTAWMRLPRDWEREARERVKLIRLILQIHDPKDGERNE